jgi:hypothetical protein
MLLRSQKFVALEVAPSRPLRTTREKEQEREELGDVNQEA